MTKGWYCELMDALTDHGISGVRVYCSWDESRQEPEWRVRVPEHMGLPAVFLTTNTRAHQYLKSMRGLREVAQ